MNYTVIILGVVLVIMVYILYRYLSTSSSSLSAKADLKIANPPMPITVSPQSSRYAYGIWVYINTWSSGSYSPIFWRPASGGAATFDGANGAASTNQFSMYLDKTTPTLFCTIAQQPGAGCTNMPIALTTNFPIQKWVYVVASVDGQFTDLYLDGKLVKSIKLACIPVQPGSSTSGDQSNTIVLSKATAPFDAYVAGFKVWPTPLTPQDVWSNYMSGNGNSMSSMFSSYGVTVGLTKDNVQQTQFALF